MSPQVPHRVVAVVQARLGSQRFPRKVLSEIAGQPALQLQVSRLRRSNTVQDICLAIPDTDENLPLVDWAQIFDPLLSITRGSELDVLDRCCRTGNES